MKKKTICLIIKIYDESVTLVIKIESVNFEFLNFKWTCVNYPLAISVIIGCSDSEQRHINL